MAERKGFFKRLFGGSQASTESAAQPTTSSFSEGIISDDLTRSGLKMMLAMLVGPDQYRAHASAIDAASNMELLKTVTRLSHPNEPQSPTTAPSTHTPEPPTPVPVPEPRARQQTQPATQPDRVSRIEVQPSSSSSAIGHAQAGEQANMSRRAWDYQQRSGMGVPGNVPNPNYAPPGYYQGGPASNRPPIGADGRPIPPRKPPGNAY